jgi:transposase
MPWKASSVMEERLRFVARLLDGEAMTEVCREFGISRKTGYKMFDRYKEHGLAALSDRSRRPVRYANQLPEQIEGLIVRLKAEKPHWGARKIRELLVRRRIDSAAATVGRLRSDMVSAATARRGRLHHDGRAVRAVIPPQVDAYAPPAPATRNTGRPCCTPWSLEIFASTGSEASKPFTPSLSYTSLETYISSASARFWTRAAMFTV